MSMPTIIMQNSETVKPNLAFFAFNNTQVRVLDINDEPWFIAGDLCSVLGLTDVEVSLRRLDEDEKLIRTVYSSGQNRAVAIVSESGMYSLVLTSRKPQAKTFKKWITSEVLPAIRKNGKYDLNEELQKALAREETAVNKLQNVIAQKRQEDANYYANTADMDGLQEIVDEAKASDEHYIPPFMPAYFCLAYYLYMMDITVTRNQRKEIGRSLAAAYKTHYLEAPRVEKQKYYCPDRQKVVNQRVSVYSREFAPTIWQYLKSQKFVD